MGGKFVRGCITDPFLKTHFCFDAELAKLAIWDIRMSEALLKIF